ncbi:hypothetical protein DL771_000351 [Monosporascus sp. 5C6A]|nr:hypothetical protein DL771_000351 [Monosporascus sp. 5C6A]
MEASAPKRRKTSPTGTIPIHGRDASPHSTNIDGATTPRARRIAARPAPRPLPPPSAEEEEPIDPFRGRMLRRSPPPGVLPTLPPDEPDLPPTPTQKGISDPASINTSPVGIHNTPSKRARRSRTLAEKLKSSPLKQPPLRPPRSTEKAPARPVLPRARHREAEIPAGNTQALKEEELPCLQVFTPLTFTSTVSVLPREDLEDGKPLMQKHSISVSSVPPGLFSARVEMTVNAKTLSVSELSVPQLDPSAARELRPFVQRTIQGRNSSALTRNVGVVTWAMGEWVRVATRRARFWCSIEKELANREGIAKCVKQMRQGRRRKLVGRSAAMEDADVDSEEELLDGADKTETKGNGFSRTDILRSLGKSSFDIDLCGGDEAPSVRVEWNIGFDWTGEAQSKLALLVTVPAKWHGSDKAKSLANIPGIFDNLMTKNEDAMEAVRTVVALLASEGRS